MAFLGKLFAKIVDWFAALAVIVMTSLVFFQVTNRYIIGWIVPWTEEVSRILFIWITFVGAYIALKTNSHIAVITFFNRFTPKNEHPFQKPALYRLSKIKELGYEHRAETKVDIGGISYRINRLGFRDIDHRFRKTDERVVIVGDSITFGWNLPLEDTYHYQTREKLKSQGRPIEIMAMGITGYNLMQEHFLIKERALRYAPDLIVLQICLNDFERALGIRPDPKQQFLLTKSG